jgi:hypothetical protein
MKKRQGGNKIRNILIASVFIIVAIGDVVILLYIFNPGVFNSEVRNKIQNGLSPSNDKEIVPVVEEPVEEPEVLPDETSSEQILINVPFTTQAPLAEWDDIRQQEACEEASVIMAWYWIKNAPLSLQKAKEEILALSAFEEELVGEFWDTSAEDTAKIFTAYYGHKNLKVVYGFSAEGIKKELSDGNIVLIPTDGATLQNPNYTPPGPRRHMIVIKGFDGATGEFITNDPGTRMGNGYRYKYQTVMSSIINYGTGRNVPLVDNRKVMIVVGK